MYVRMCECVHGSVKERPCKEINRSEINGLFNHLTETQNRAGSAFGYRQEQVVVTLPTGNRRQSSSTNATFKWKKQKPT